MGKPKTKTPKSNANQQSNRPQKTESNNAKEEVEGQANPGLIGSITAGVCNVINSMTTNQPEKPEASCSQTEKSAKSPQKNEEEVTEQGDMGKRKAEELAETDDVKVDVREDTALLSPEEKQPKINRDGIDKKLADLFIEIKDLSGKPKKKALKRLKESDPSLYERYIEENSKRWASTGEQPAKNSDEKVTPKKEEKKADVQRPKTDKKKATEAVEKKAEVERPKTDEKKATEAVEKKEEKQKLKRDTNVLDKKLAEETLQGVTSDSWEDNDWEVDETPSVDDAKKADVEEYAKDLEKNSGALPKQREKISFGFKSQEDGSDWSDTKTKTDKKEHAQERNEEANQGARAKEHEGLTKNQKKNQKKKGKKQTKLIVYPPGHAKYVQVAEQPQHEPVHYAAGTSTQHSRPRSSSAGRNTVRPWDLQVYKRPDGSVILQEVKGDLFYMADNVSLVHCVSEDFHMGKGIAVQFKNKFGGVSELMSFGARTGQMAYLKRGNRFIYYLVTKVRYNRKPTLNTLRASLQSMHKHCKDNGVKELAMPTIGCGLDNLDWYVVREMVRDIFRDIPVEITVCIV